MKSLAFTGHRSGRLPYPNSHEYQVVKAEIESAVVRAVEAGYVRFITGMAAGVDQLAAEICLDLRESSFGQIVVEAAVPFPGQADRWPKEHRDIYLDLLAVCDKVTTVSPRYTHDVYFVRDKWMVDEADSLIGVWDGIRKGGTWYTMKYALDCGVPVMVIRMEEDSQHHRRFVKSSWYRGGEQT
jgi:uncharacterized phage-like protein YoqJ